MLLNPSKRLFSLFIVPLLVIMVGCGGDRGGTAVVIPEFDSGLVSDGSFEFGSDAWSGNAVNFQPEEGNETNTVNFADVAVAGNGFDVNLSQALNITQGKRYTLQFRAKTKLLAAARSGDEFAARTADTRTMTAGIGLNEAPFSNTVEEVTLTTEWQTFTLTLDASGFGGPISRVLFDMGADTGVVVLDDVILKLVGDIPAIIDIPSTSFDDGLLVNGDFESGSAGWIGNAASVTDELLGFGGTLANFASVDVAGDAFNVNLSQVVAITMGETYTLTFMAKSDGNRSILAGIGLNEDPWTNKSQSVDLTTEWQTFTLTLPATDFGSANSRVLFDMGAETGQVIIDNVSLKKVGGGSPTDPTDPTDPVVPVVPVAPPVAGCDTGTFNAGLLTNGDFEAGVSPWFGQAANVTDELLGCNGTKANFANILPPLPANAFDVNLSQIVAITEDAIYTLTFKAKSDRNRTMIAGIGLNEGDFANNSKTVNLTPNWQTYTLTLPATGFGSINSRVLFDMGAALGVVIIDEVSLVQAGGVTPPPPPATALKLTVAAAGATEVRMTGEFWGWDPAGGPVATSNGDGTWTVTLDPAPAADMLYLWVVDTVQENLLNNTPQDLSCTPVTDSSTYANRQWTVGSANVSADIYDACSGGTPPPPAVALTLTVAAAGATEVRMTGEFWGWDPAGGPVATNNGDGTWTVTLDPAPAADMLYLWVVDTVQENLLNNTPQDLSCTPITDGANYANRQWTVGSANVTGDIYDACSVVSPPPPPSDSQVDLPVTFDATGVDYTLTDFGDAVSTLVADPADAANMVVSTVKPTSAPLWAGTTIGNVANAVADQGFATVIPFTASATTMSVRVYSPDAGTIVRLKVERSDDDKITAETEAMTIAADTWETLEFDLNMVAAGTAPFDPTAGYDKASIFFNFGTDGATAGEKTYLWDDVEFGGSVPVNPEVSGVIFSGAFGGTAVDGNTYTYPTGAEAWGGFANEDTSLYPFAFANGGNIEFTASAPDGDVTLKFKFEKAAHPDVDPSFETVEVVISGSDQSYSVAIPAQASENTYSSFLLYLVTQDLPVTISDLVVNAGTDPVDPVDPVVPGVIFSGAFGGTTIDGNTYTYPTGAEAWGGFANEDTSLYPFAFANGGNIEFTASAPDGDVTLKFKFEKAAHPDVDPSFETAEVVISGSDQSYTVAISAQAPENTYSSFLLYLVTRDLPVSISNLVVNGSSAPVDPVTGELAVNGDFESGGLAGWTLYQIPPVLSTTEGVGGTSAANLVLSGSGVSVLKQERIAIGTVMTGQVLDISFKMKGTAGIGGVINPNLLFENDGMITNIILETIGNPSTGYTTYTYSPTVTGNVTGGISLEIAAACGADAGCNVNVFVDDVTITIR